MNAPDSFVEDLQRFDPALRVRFATEPDRRTRRPLERWVIERFVARLGEWHQVLVVQEPNGAFRPLDNRVMHRLHQMDTWRHGGLNLGQWKSHARRAFMNNLGLREDETDPFMERWEIAAQRRYDEQVHRLADRLMHAMRRDPGYVRASGEDEKAIRQRLDDAIEVRHAKRVGRGVLEFHPKFRHIRVRPGTLS